MTPRSLPICLEVAACPPATVTDRRVLYVRSPPSTPGPSQEPILDRSLAWTKRKPPMYGENQAWRPGVSVIERLQSYSFHRSRSVFMLEAQGVCNCLFDLRL